MIRCRCGIFFLLMGLVASPCLLAQGTLRLGKPAKNGSTVTVPVLLEGEVGDGVAALDFTLRYDPALLAPTGVRAGDAAATAGKGVQYNVTAPGRYVVMMFGLNQTTIQNGKVADIALRTLAAGEGTTTDIAIGSTTLASLSGDTIASKGSTRTLDLSAEIPEEPTDPADPTDPTDPADPTDPGDPGDPATPPTDTPEGPADPSGPVVNPGTPTGGIPSVPDSGQDTDGSSGGGRSAPAGAPLSRSMNAANSGLAQLERMARELERKRAQLPTPSVSAQSGGGTSADAELTEGAASQGKTPGTGLPPGGFPNGGEQPGSARTEVALLAPQTAGTAAAPDAALRTMPPVEPRKPWLGRVELWLAAGVATVFGLGLLLRKRLFS
ncbi:MAG: hypothetical protein IT365_25255 [Candidatus Hydrogenedentes bacterium]|nr:hypothetical protein [Candidatus Hydrogenedentota bacterium]